VALLSKSLAEEENADQLLNQVARSLMSVRRSNGTCSFPASVAKMPDAVEQASLEEAE
jgi:Mn-containing catalase